MVQLERKEVNEKGLRKMEPTLDGLKVSHLIHIVKVAKPRKQCGSVCSREKAKVWLDILLLNRLGI
jgi:hypothetical protein